MPVLPFAAQNILAVWPQVSGATEAAGGWRGLPPKRGLSDLSLNG
jgi:hypothetical protein